MTDDNRPGWIRNNAFPVAVLVALVVIGVVYQTPLLEWFAGDAEVAADRAPSGASASKPKPNSRSKVEPAAPRVVQHRLGDAAMGHMTEAWSGYDALWAKLTDDELAGLDTQAERLDAALTEAAAELGDAPRAVASALIEAADAARRMGAAKDIEGARLQFGRLSEQLVKLGRIDPRLQDGRSIYSCPMAAGYQEWLQPVGDMRNPYMGQKMLTCGSVEQWGPDAAPAPPQAPVGDAHADHAGGDREVAYYTCAMHPSVREHVPGQCPICHMDLTPVTREESETGVIVIDSVRRQRIGVRTATAQLRELSRSIRAVGRVVYDESRVHDVTLRVESWIERLHVDRTGQKVRKGQPLFTAYSPELFSAQLELLAATGNGTAVSDRLSRAARQRLRGWGLSNKQIDAVIERGEARESITFPSPASGFVVEKNVVQGAHVAAGQRLYRIVAMDRVWVEADIYEQDLPHVSVGQQVTVTLPYLRGRSFEGEVAFVYPYLAGENRTGKVRIELDNRKGELRPDMFANVELPFSLGKRLSIPTEAVVYTGPRRLVFVDLGEGRLRPQEVTIGATAGGFVEVLSGLKEGDIVVTSGNFLVAAESRIRSAAKYWGGDDE